ncbi:sulfotransferase [Okeania sp.]|uniref:sulfotransferase family protein n=1 Tax=Okeania sp. TaxID=3100323 RepID=UPI002B4AC402|nr:sulfotransferase [Okeania sp.]MEB3342540.1 sulfotransferase [Okeania sp.]
MKLQNIPKTTEINWSNILEWAKKTAKEDRKKYQSRKRPISSSRLLSLLIPNLRRPIFIIGSPRSGTTFLGTCLGSLPEISYHFEPVATKAAARYIYEKNWGITKGKWFYGSVYSWLMRLHLDADLRFAEKTPRNCFLIDFLATTFPEAQFIHIIRDGRDAALSHSKKPWLQAAQAKSSQRESGGYPYGPYPRFWVEVDRRQEFQETTDIHRCIWAWRRHTETALGAFSNFRPEKYHELRYESLVNNPIEEGDRLLNYLGISSSQSRNLFHAVVSKARTDSIGNWKRELSEEQLQQIYLEAGELLEKLGYYQN